MLSIYNEIVEFYGNRNISLSTKIEIFSDSLWQTIMNKDINYWGKKLITFCDRQQSSGKVLYIIDLKYK